MAEDLYELFPWLRIIISLREPISRAASMLVHLSDRNISTSNYGQGGCLAANDMDLGKCLYQHSQIRGDDWGGPTEYASPLKAWLETFPKDQLFILQVRWDADVFEPGTWIEERPSPEQKQMYLDTNVEPCFFTKLLWKLLYLALSDMVHGASGLWSGCFFCLRLQYWMPLVLLLYDRPFNLLPCNFGCLAVREFNVRCRKRGRRVEKIEKFHWH